MSKKIYAAVWTPGNYRQCKFKYTAEDLLKVWKRWYERLGWKVTGSGSGAHIATSPDGEQHAIVLHIYDALTSERIVAPLPEPKTREQVLAELAELRRKSAREDAQSKRAGRKKPAWA